jgi:hypothetical protein
VTDQVMKLNLDGLQALADAATPGPWEAARSPDKFDPEGKVVEPSTMHLTYVAGPPAAGSKTPEHICGTGGFGDKQERNAMFIAAARHAVPALIAELRGCDLARSGDELDGEGVADTLARYRRERDAARRSLAMLADSVTRTREKMKSST